MNQTNRAPILPCQPCHHIAMRWGAVAGKAEINHRLGEGGFVECEIGLPQPLPRAPVFRAQGQNID